MEAGFHVTETLSGYLLTGRATDRQYCKIYSSTFSKFEVLDVTYFE